MIKKLNVVVASILLLIAFSSPVFSSENTLASDSIKVKITVPVIQRVEVLKPAVVEFDYPWDGAEEGDPLVVEDAGALKVKSNADWALQLDSFSNGNFRVLVRRAGDDDSNWKSVSGSNSYFYGKSGREEVGFDLKILPAGGAVQGTDTGSKKATGRVQLSYTLEQN